MDKKLLILSIMVLTLLVVGIGFVSAQDIVEKDNTMTIQQRVRMRLFGSKEDNALITPEFLEDEEVVAKIAEHNGMTVDEVRDVISEHKDRFLKFGEKGQGHMDKGTRHMDMGEKMEKLLENEDFLSEMAQRHGVSVEELKTWLESSPLLKNR
ncbi:hypothetical protein HYG86_15800 [Alkalicella caledoniensis]|uniref:Uncharacterized protein n=1 Tax=Alkalicella caledoniensis TaxID=2731377 RepID=A0A7G9WBR6_ALKCA|nr:hypothetical protein [Alkalicella caledoniensis]QNO16128.1 hypothetical protein HYG86_15800 [Alkalicella caledoniensis]